MPDHQQIQQSKKPDTILQKHATPVIQMPVSNPYFIIQRAKINPKSLTHADVMQLQRTIGNQAVGRLLSSIGTSSTAQQATVQRQEISEEACPSCIQKQEIPEEEEPLQGKTSETVQRQEIPEEEEPLQGKLERVTGSNEPVLRKVDPTTTVNGVPVNDDPSLEHEADVMGVKAAQFVPAPKEEDSLQGKFGEGMVQKAEKAANNTGLPDNLKAGIENLSGMSMDGVKVHYNSRTPAQLNALAYAQGSDIHVAPGQERHLPHEAWHVVQQAQGRVQPTIQMLSAEEIIYLNERSKIDDDHTRAMMILELPGSGDEHWRGENQMNIGAQAEGIEQKVFFNAGPPEVWTIAGPQAMGGMSDSGPNSIENNVITGVQLITDFVEEQKAGQEILIFLKSHSRNAVACTRIANAIKKLYKDSNYFYERNESFGLNTNNLKKVTVEAVFFDPVPGPDHVGEDVENKVSHVDESTLVYSIHTQHWYGGFTPQKVLGAKRLILSFKNHGVGYQFGVKYQDKIYKGLSLNGLLKGAYISCGERKEEDPEVIRQATLKEVLDALDLYNNNKYSQRERREIIKAVSINFFGH